MTLLWLLGGCAGDPCARYSDLPFAQERCRVVEAAHAATIEAARCGEAESAEEDCRLTWVETHLDRTVDELLAACTTLECAFVALDFRPSPLPEQLVRCDKFAATAQNCVLHAFVRYYAERQPAASQLEVLGALGTWSALGAEEASLARSCGFAVECSAFGAFAPTCEAAPSRRVDCGVYRKDFPRPREERAQPSRTSP